MEFSKFNKREKETMTNQKTAKKSAFINFRLETKNINYS